MSILGAVSGFFSKLFSFFKSDKAQALAQKIATAAQELLPLSEALAEAGFKPAAVANVFLNAGIHYLGDLHDGTLEADVKTVIETTLLAYAKSKWGVNDTQAKLVINSAYALVQIAEAK